MTEPTTTAEPTVGGLRVNGRVDPVGLGDSDPLLGWEVRGPAHQSAYELRFAASAKDLLQDRPSHRTGRIESTRQHGVETGLAPLTSRQRVAWQVRVWAGDAVSDWSRVATWEMGLLGRGDWSAHWIEHPTYAHTDPDGEPLPLPVFARRFDAPGRLRRAVLHVTGLGMYAATINGEPVGEAVLEPGQSSYAEEVHYRTHDVTHLTRPGANVVGIETGSGAYQRVPTPGRYHFGGDLEVHGPPGRPKVLAQLELELADGSRTVIATDETWRSALGPTVYSSWWAGEAYDARRSAFSPRADVDPEADGWVAARRCTLSGSTVPATTTALVPDPRPPVTVVRRIQPVAMWQVGEAWVLDFGANRSGWPAVEMAMEAGRTVTLTPAEALHPDGRIDTGSTGVVDGAAEVISYSYTCAGGSTERWWPRFTYSGFRYLRVDGLPSAPGESSVAMLELYASNPRAAEFSSSNPVLRELFRITRRSVTSNMMSVLTDCPNREKGPYTGDNLHNIDALLTLFDMSAYQPQQVANMATSQRKADDEHPGLIANIAPEFHRVRPTPLHYPQGTIQFLDEINWGSAIVRVPRELHLAYGDTRSMRRFYPAMVAWMDYQARNWADHDGNIPGLGDWSALDNTTPLQLPIVAGYRSAAAIMAETAQVLGLDGDVQEYRLLAEELAAEFNRRFRHTAEDGTVFYGSNSQASNAMALEAGLVAEEDRAGVLQHLVSAVRSSGNHITTGSVALGPLFRALQDADRDDVILDMVTTPTPPGYGHLVAQGYTTLPEDLAGGSSLGGSLNHHFLGQVADWLVRRVAGIRQAPGSRGYRDVLIAPAHLPGLASAGGSYRTPFGWVRVKWDRTDADLELGVEVPSGVRALIVPPGSRAGTIPVSPGRHVMRLPIG